MKRFLLPAIILLIASCNSNTPETISLTEKKDTACVKPLNPNGDGELALLMRDMTATTQSIKDSMIKGSEIPAYPDRFGKIFFAKKTDSEIDKDLFDGLAQNYISTVKYFYDSKKEDKAKAFNGMVRSCINCHENFCHGPIVRIKKLFLPKESL